MLRALQILAAALILASCAPRPSIKLEGAALRCTPAACTLTASGPIDYGVIALAGPNLQVRAPLCGGVCPMSMYGFTELTLPDRAQSYPAEIVLELTRGSATLGRALITLQGATHSTEALLE